MAARKSKSAGKAAPKKRSESASKSSAKSKARREFVSEAEEIVERMREDLADLADQRAGDAEIDPDLVNQIFRSAHSLKGLAGMFGLDGIGELAHHMEDILDGLRLGRLPASAPAVDLLDEGVALFAGVLQSIDKPGDDEEQTSRINSLIGRIDGAVSEAPAERDDLESLSLDASLLRALTEYEEHRLRESMRRGRHLALVDSLFEIIAFEEGLSELSAAIRESGEVVSTLPSPGDAPESQIRFSLLVASDLPVEQLAARLDQSGVDVTEVMGGSSPDSAAAREAAASTPDESEPNAAGEPAAVVQASEATTAPTPAPRAAAELQSLRSISETVRVDIRKLDELMNLVGELVIQRNAISSITNRLASETETARIGGELAKLDKMLDRKLKELQAGVLDVRMVPLRQVFEKLSRVVRRLRRDHDKNVTLDFKGADTELDKLIVEQLVDPLMHIVRNAFDHAIESAAERKERNKPPEAKICIQASQRANHVVIEVIDDGRGIDPAQVRAAAEAKGLVEPDEVLTPKETLDLVFSAGLSTRDEISETSGRGVGMDVVRSNLAGLGGMVDIASTLGVGTTVTLTLPITLAIIQALIVGAGEGRFAISLNSVLETLLIDEDEIQQSEGRELLNLRGDALLLRRLRDEFDLEGPDTGGKQYVVVLGMGEQRVGLLVDRLHGQQDTVIKPIKGTIRHTPGIAGATELGDQGVVLVLDVSHIVAEAMRRREAA